MQPEERTFKEDDNDEFDLESCEEIDDFNEEEDYYYYEEEEEEEEEENQGDDTTDFKEEGTSLVNETPMIFKTHTTIDLIKKMNKQCINISQILFITQDDAINLLQYFSWNSDKLMEEYVTNPSKVRKDAGLTEESHDIIGNFTTYSPNEEFICFICCDKKVETYKLSCNHEYCMDCYKIYAEGRLNEGRVIKCPDGDCNLALQTHDIDNICGKGSSMKLLESSIKEYVERLPSFKWCPAPDCKGIVEVLNLGDMKDFVEAGKIPIVRCGDHDHRFCVSCLYENHSPAPCQITKNWINKCKDDSETVKWIMTNTQVCPRCETSIEKNGGCNHMTCKKCRYEFCWICSGEWSLHGTQYYNCNRFNDPKNKEEEQLENKKKKKETIKATKESLQRYLHFYNLFIVHESSTKLDMKRCFEVEETVRDLQIVSGMSWIEAQFIVDSARVLLNGRQCLKWSYPLVFYCDESPYLNIFENVQNELAMSVESLSKLFEIEESKEIVNKKKEFIDACGVVIIRQNAILSCLKELMDTGTLPKDAMIFKKTIS